MVSRYYLTLGELEPARQGQLMPDVVPALEPKRFVTFVKYFNNYLAALTVALIPIPLANWSWLPIFGAQRHILSVITPVFCFLTFGLLFYYRHLIGRVMFPMARSVKIGNAAILYVFRAFRGLWMSVILSAPLILVASSFLCAAQYYACFEELMRGLKDSYVDQLALADIKNGGWLICYFVLAFIFAEAAFVWMALKEYIQDILGITDLQLLAPAAATSLSKPLSAPGPSAPAT
jgi:hypothetical protein